MKNYVDILSLSIRDRKYKIRSLSASEKSRFWKAQMVYHLATSEFSNRQKQFISNVFPIMTENAFNFPLVRGQEKNTTTKNLESFISKGYEFFSKDEFFIVFMGYGIHKSTKKKDSVETSNSLMKSCDCNYVCGLSSTCTSTSCAISTDGCGILGGTPCESYCIDDGIVPEGGGNN